MAASYAVKLDDDVRGVLERSVISNASLTLPAGTLDRALYVKVNKVLELAGGKWNRSAKAHLFKSDPREVLGLALDKGSIVDTKKQMQQFFTPPETAEYVIERAELEPGMSVLEPSAGEGALAVRARDEGAIVTCIEFDPALTKKLEALRLSVSNGDFLETTPNQQFDRVVMNPPFTKGQDVDHVTHAFKFVKTGGRLVAIMSAGVKSNSDKKTTAFRKLVDDHGGTIEDLPDGAFSESGTMVRTVLVVLDK